jgi:hypothetical protein
MIKFDRIDQQRYQSSIVWRPDIHRLYALGSAVPDGAVTFIKTVNRCRTGKLNRGRSKSFAPEEGTALAFWPLTAMSRNLFGKINPDRNPVRERSPHGQGFNAPIRNSRRYARDG